jgi:hypothetical protein
MSKKGKILAFEQVRKPNQFLTEEVLSDLFFEAAARDIYAIFDLAMLQYGEGNPISVQEYASTMVRHQKELAEHATRRESLDTNLVFAYAASGQLSLMQKVLDNHLRAVQRQEITELKSAYNIATAFAVAADTSEIISYCTNKWLQNPENIGEMLVAMPALAVGDRVCLDIRRPERVYETMGLDTDNLGTKLRLKAENLLHQKLPDYISRIIPEPKNGGSDNKNQVLLFKRK